MSDQISDTFYIIKITLKITHKPFLFLKLRIFKILIHYK